jgi:hypothetical protein
MVIAVLGKRNTLVLGNLNVTANELFYFFRTITPAKLQNDAVFVKPVFLDFLPILLLAIENTDLIKGGETLRKIS